ncbi:hypothetical protein V8G54_022818 [Vigna mungo]|uniref:Uncharacterized protein n=1 Tax=Vigna mungo TaxID=3915 RepID=A0AAQ3RPR4_VIGMU
MHYPVTCVPNKVHSKCLKKRILIIAFQELSLKVSHKSFSRYTLNELLQLQNGLQSHLFSISLLSTNTYLLHFYILVNPTSTNKIMWVLGARLHFKANNTVTLFFFQKFARRCLLSRSVF